MLPFECLNYNTSFHIGVLATFRPTECLISTASYVPRAAPDGMEPHADFGLFGMGKGDRGLGEPPVPLLDSLSTGPGCPNIAGRWRDANESQSCFVNIRVRQRPRRTIEQAGSSNHGTENVMEAMIRGCLEGDVRLDWRAEGLACEITFPA